MANKVFAYGTLNLHETQDWLWGERMRGVVAQLDDYRLNAYTNGIYYLTKEFGETVAGKIYTISDEQLKRTDAYEGKSYERVLVRIDGVSVNVYVRSKDESKIDD